MPRRLFIVAIVLFSCFFVPLPKHSRAASNAAVGRDATVIKDVPYPGAAKGDRRRSLELYLPAKADTKPPLLIFIHGGFWLLTDDDYRIGPSLAENLVRDGVAVALVRYRLAPANRHPAQAEDVAAAGGVAGEINAFGIEAIFVGVFN